MEGLNKLEDGALIGRGQISHLLEAFEQPRRFGRLLSDPQIAQITQMRR
jgi:hypothetical protein